MIRSFLRVVFVQILLICGFHVSSNGNTYRAADANAFNQLSQQLKAGDSIILLNGIWKDAVLVITASGTESDPIIIVAETPGKLTLEGTSCLRLGGNYIEVSGLMFRNGYTPGSAVIEFRTDATHLANHCRVYDCVVYDYNNPNRMKDDVWVLLYGRYNQVDHNYFSDKKNLGPVLVVELNNELNQKNFHHIHHNFFGTRPRMGGNGGETIRLANATFSLTSSNTIIENNFFYHCDGEAEVVSIKASDNIIKGNTFYESEGSLVLRHGNRNLVEGNFFIGNNKPFTGGLRIINYGHKIIGNYFYKLKGERFRAAMIVMNGVPNSPLIRYEPVKDVLIANNDFIDCDNIELSAGKDYERTAVPKNVRMEGNIFFQSRKSSMVKVYDDISGFSFKENWSNTPQLTTVLNTGLKLRNDQGNEWPSVYAVKKNEPARRYTSADVTGASWFDKKHFSVGKKVEGRTIHVPVAMNSLFDAAVKAGPNDILVLEEGTYRLSKTIEVNLPLTIQSPTKSIIQFDGERGGFAFFSIGNGGSLQLSGLHFDGTSPNGVAETIIRTARQSLIEHYNLKVDNCVFTNVSGGRAFTAYAGTFADSIIFRNCLFNDLSGNVISLAAEKEDRGYYNVENIVFENCVFNKILYGAIDIYRGGIDESSLGPFVTMDHCTFNNVGNAELGFAVRLHGVQHSDLKNLLFNNSGKSGRAIWFEDFGWTKNSIRAINLYESGRIESFYNNILKGNPLNVKPVFVNEAKLNFQLSPGSSLSNKGTDGKALGITSMK